MRGNDSCLRQSLDMIAECALSKNYVTATWTLILSFMRHWLKQQLLV